MTFFYVINYYKLSKGDVVEVRIGRGLIVFVFRAPQELQVSLNKGYGPVAAVVSLVSVRRFK